MTVREILKILRKDGWYEVDQDGSHKQLNILPSLGKPLWQFTLART